MNEGQNGPALLRGIRTSDAEGMCRMSNMPAYINGSLRLPHSSLDYWQKRLAERDLSESWIVAELDGELVGAGAVLTNSNPRIAHIGEMVLGVADHVAGRGIGTQIMAALIDIADNWRGLRRLELDVIADNDVAIRIYKKFGFEIEGRQLKSTLRNGEFVDSFCMARLNF